MNLPHPDPYGFDRWGDSMFEVLANGELGLVDAARPGLAPVSLASIVDDLQERGISAPLVIRVQAFLRNQITALNETFGAAIDRVGYNARYHSVFPIKVNQQADVVDRIIDYGRPWSVGLEAGSKPELMIALSRDLPDDAMIVCNGVKDEDFVRLAISANSIGAPCVIVIESLGELDIVLRVAAEADRRPLLGVRVKLTQESSGSWSSSSGDRSSFGVNATDLLTVVERLRAHDMLDCLVLQHSHIGSQIPNANEIRSAVGEAARFHVALRGEGAPLTHLDLGGGLGVDYTGEHRSSENSVNYTLDEYCTNMVETVKYVMDEAGAPHPVLMTESGRAIVASSSILVFDVLEATRFDRDEPIEEAPTDHELLGNLIHIHSYIDEARLQECVSDAEYYRDELRENFRRGLLTLREMARTEQAYLTVIHRVKEIAATADTVSDGIRELIDREVDIYHGNLSVFQSLPDSWAIGQIHPVAPIRRLNEVPTRRATISDTTCDSDGKIDSFATGEGVRSSLPVHELVDGERYQLGAFFMGAYQETLGDLHNLFGDTHVVTVGLCDGGGYELLVETAGDTISDVLSYVEYDPASCLEGFTRRVDAAVASGGVDSTIGDDMIAAYGQVLSGSTYFQP